MARKDLVSDPGGSVFQIYRSIDPNLERVEKEAQITFILLSLSIIDREREGRKTKKYYFLFYFILLYSILFYSLRYP
jgi:hypothetical protein